MSHLQHPLLRLLLLIGLRLQLSAALTLWGVAQWWMIDFISRDIPGMVALTSDRTKVYLQYLPPQRGVGRGTELALWSHSDVPIARMESALVSRHKPVLNTRVLGIWYSTRNASYLRFVVRIRLWLLAVTSAMMCLLGHWWLRRQGQTASPAADSPPADSSPPVDSSPAR